VTRTLVVGAGWAGLAAAVGLVEAGHETTVLEAGPEPGGRARTLALTLGRSTIELDNGQHLLIGAYRSTLALVRRVGVDPSSVLVRTRMRLDDTRGLSMRAAPLPAPWHLAWAMLAARGLPWSHRLAMARAMAWLRRAGPEAVPADRTVSDWLAERGQPAALVARIWGPLCLGALNTSPEAACARAFAQVLRDALLARAPDSDFLLPRTSLGDVLPRPAAAWLAARGATLRLRCACRALAREGGGWRARTDAGELVADRVVLAVPPWQVPRLLGDALDAPTAARLAAFEPEPIATVWLAWDAPVALPAATMLEERPDAGEHGQWLFGRGPAPGAAPGAVAGVVVSAAGHRAEDPRALAEGIARQVASQLRVPAPAHARAIVDKRATIRCSPDRPRFEVDALATTAPGVALAGDWCWHRYPATIESAVRSGDAAAAWLSTGEARRP